MGSTLFIEQFLGCRAILDPGKTVVPLLIVKAGTVHLSG
jgi:hypothetical protein